MVRTVEYKQVNGNIYRHLGYGMNDTIKVQNSNGDIFFCPEYICKNGLVSDGIEKSIIEKDTKYLIGETLHIKGKTIVIVSCDYRGLGVLIDGEIMYCKKSSLFALGILQEDKRSRSTIIGKTIFQEGSNMNATCISVLSRDRVTIRFENGIEHECDRKNFMCGRVSSNKDKAECKQARIGHIYENYHGFKVKIISQVKEDTCLCCYEDGGMELISTYDLTQRIFKDRVEVSGKAYFDAVTGKYVEVK